MDKDELLKTVCVNLRSVTQSCKGGVPLKVLQSDYKCLIGKEIPYKELGYNSLENFLRSIPNCICLQKNNADLIAEAVADESTAHIASLVSRQKSSNSSKAKAARKAFFVTRKYPTRENKKQSHTKVDSQKGGVTWKAIDIGGIQTKKRNKGKKEGRQQLPTTVSENIQTCTKSPIAPNTKVKKTGLSAGQKNSRRLKRRRKRLEKEKAEALSKQTNQTDHASGPKEKNQNVRPTISDASTSILQGKKEKANVQQAQVGCISNTKCKQKVVSKSSETGDKQALLPLPSLPNRPQSLSLKGISRIRDRIATANFNSLLLLNVILFGDTFTDTLRRSVLSFDGFTFTEGSEKWKQAKLIFSMLPEDSIRDCMNLLCLECEDENQEIIYTKLLQFLSFPINQSGGKPS